MNYYIEIKLLPDAEFTAPVLMNALFNKLHKTLFDIQSDSIGASFPNYALTLGDKVRLHGTQENLSKLPDDWIGRMKDYCNVSQIQLIPEGAEYKTVSRKQDSKSNAKLRRLLNRQEQGKRGDRPALSESDIKEFKLNMLKDQQTGPFLELMSSKGNRYRRYIKQSDSVQNPVEGKFDHFGLSNIATIPWF